LVTSYLVFKNGHGIDIKTITAKAAWHEICTEVIVDNERMSTSDALNDDAPPYVVYEDYDEDHGANKEKRKLRIEMPDGNIFHLTYGTFQKLYFTKQAKIIFLNNLTQ